LDTFFVVIRKECVIVFRTIGIPVLDGVIGGYHTVVAILRLHRGAATVANTLCNEAISIPPYQSVRAVGLWI
jgi:hypothetical protein